MGGIYRPFPLPWSHRHLPRRCVFLIIVHIAQFLKVIFVQFDYCILSRNSVLLNYSKGKERISSARYRVMLFKLIYHYEQGTDTLKVGTLQGCAKAKAKAIREGYWAPHLEIVKIF